MRAPNVGRHKTLDDSYPRNEEMRAWAKSFPIDEYEALGTHHHLMFDANTTFLVVLIPNSWPLDGGAMRINNCGRCRPW